MVVRERLRTSESQFFSNDSSRKSFTSFDTYFVLLEQLASLRNEWSTLKNRLVFRLKKFNYPRLLIRAIPQYTVAIPMLSLLFAISFKFSRTSKNVVFNSFCCFLFLNCGKKVGQLQVTRLMRKASIRVLKNESSISSKTII